MNIVHEENAKIAAYEAQFLGQFRTRIRRLEQELQEAKDCLADAEARQAAGLPIIKVNK